MRSGWFLDVVLPKTDPLYKSRKLRSSRAMYGLMILAVVAILWSKFLDLFVSGKVGLTPSVVNLIVMYLVFLLIGKMAFVTIGIPYHRRPLGMNIKEYLLFSRSAAIFVPTMTVYKLTATSEASSRALILSAVFLTASLLFARPLVRTVPERIWSGLVWGWEVFIGKRRGRGLAELRDLGSRIKSRKL